jgi:hypothetical protein
MSPSQPVRERSQQMTTPQIRSALIVGAGIAVNVTDA